MNKFVRVVAVLAIVALAWLLRMRAVSQLPTDFDEDDYLRAAQQMAGAIRDNEWSALSDIFDPGSGSLALYMAPVIIIRAFFAFNQFYIFLVLQIQGSLCDGFATRCAARS